MYRILSTLVLLINLSSGNSHKCPNKFIYITGRVSGPDDSQLQIKVEVTPDANWEPQPAIKLDHGTFDGKVYFDSTKAEGTTQDVCSRVPEAVRVELYKDRTLLDSIQLDISKDFIKNKFGDYKLRSALVLHSAGPRL